MNNRPPYATRNPTESPERFATPRLPSFRLPPFRLPSFRLPSFRLPSFRLPARSAGFSLIELLVVIAVVLLLSALLLPAVAMVRKQAKVAAARTEVKQIEAAWRQYYSAYEKWPSILGYTSTFVRISGPVARLMTRGEATPDNPRRLRFLDFKRLNADGSPVTPWADTDLTDDEMGDTEGIQRFYYAMFDMDYDNVIPGCPTCPPSVEMPLTNNIQRTVVVWTVNPDREIDDPNYIIGSWQ